MAASAAQPARRIAKSIDNNETFTLTGNTRPHLAQAQDQGEVDPAMPLTRMTFHFALSAAQAADQQQLLQQQLTRKTSGYHKWLTPEEYAARFGMNSSDIEKVSAWLSEQGFSNIEVARSRTAISFSGSAAQAQTAFHTAIHHYLTADGKVHYANSGDPVLPKALQGVAASLRGLNDIHPKPPLRPHFTSSITGNHFLTPDDFATIYDIQPLYGNGIDGTGQKIALVGQSDIALSDIRAFRSAAGLPQNDPQVILVGTDPGTIADDASESDLDLEWAGGIARNATIVFVTSKDVFTSLTYAIQNNVAPVVAITYGNCEAEIGRAYAQSLNNLLAQANLQGQTVVAASGDAGAADCDSGSTAVSGLAVDFPASSPYVTGMGGTTFSEGTGSYWNSTNNSYSGSVISYIPEIAWNDSSASVGLAGTGGGASIFFSKPGWQSGTGVPADGVRDVPDVSLASSPTHDGALYCTAGSCVNGFRDASQNLSVVGGTSLASPSFAAIVALLNQQTKGTQGNINPALYTLASFSTDAFHDVTSGNNIVTCRAATPNCGTNGQMGFTASTGYDQVTGLGSVDVYNLVREWSGDFRLTVSPTTLSVARGSSANVLVGVATEGNFAGPVNFTCSVPSALTNTTCSIPGTVNGSGTATLTITTGATATAPGWFGWNNLPNSGGPFVWISLAGLVLIAVGYSTAGRRRAPLFSGAFALVVLAAATGCGDGSGSSTTVVSSVQPVTQTGNVTIKGTSGTLTNSITIAVSVR